MNISKYPALDFLDILVFSKYLGNFKCPEKFRIFVKTGQG